jgi:hypothetical protein
MAGTAGSIGQGALRSYRSDKAWPMCQNQHTSYNDNITNTFSGWRANQIFSSLKKEQ